MALRYWRGSGSGPTGNDWSNTSNWSATPTGATGASVPVSTDDVYLQAGGTISAGLNQSAVTLASLNILPGWGGNAQDVEIGDSSGNPLQISATTLVIRNEKFSRIRLAGTYTTTFVEKCKPGAQVFVTSGAVTTLYAGKTGLFTLAADVNATNVYTAGMGLVIGPDSSSPADMTLSIGSSANVICERKITTLTVDGTLTTRGAAEGSASSGSSRWFVNSGGRLIIGSTGTIELINAKDKSTVAANLVDGAASPTTITTLVQDEGAKVNLPTSLVTVTNLRVAGDREIGFYA